MNQGRIWCVVPPAVGLPLIIGGAAVTSLIVHASVMNHTSWMNNYWQGKAAKTADLGSTSGLALNTSASPNFQINVTPVQGATSAATSFVVTVTPANPALADASPAK